jgi:hypothetical protein
MPGFMALLLLALPVSSARAGPTGGASAGI